MQGPVAVKHSTVKDEPIKDLLGNVASGLIKKLLDSKYGGDASKVPTVDYLGAQPELPTLPPCIVREGGDEEAVFTIDQTLPAPSVWVETLAGPKLNWLRALLTSVTVVQGNAYVDNPLRRLFAPRVNHKVVVRSSGGEPVSVTLYGAARSYGEHKSDFKGAEVKFDKASKAITVTVFEDRRDVSVPLTLNFQYRPNTSYAPIREVVEGRNNRIKEFYWKLWFGDDEVLPEIDVHDTYVGPEVTIKAEDIETFCDVVGNQGEAFKASRSEDVKAPMDFAIVTGWQVRTRQSLVFLSFTNSAFDRQS